MRLSNRIPYFCRIICPTMSQEEIFKNLIASMAADGEISASEYAILIAKGKDLGLSKEVVDMLIQLEMSEHSDDEYEEPRADYDKVFSSSSLFSSDYQEFPTVTFKSAITRGGNIIRPDVLIINNDSVTLRKRNTYLINCDTTTLPLQNISAVTLNTSLLGTDIIITSYGGEKIIGRKFSKSDAEQVRDIINQRRGRR